MNLITVDIAEFRNKLSDYLTLVNLGKAVICVKNAKSGKEVARIISPRVRRESAEKREKELLKLAGFAAAYDKVGREKLTKMDLEYIEKLKRGMVE